MKNLRGGAMDSGAVFLLTLSVLVFIIVGMVFFVGRLGVKNGTQNTFKFGSVILLIVGTLLLLTSPLFMFLSLPLVLLCFFMAYRSYKAGKPVMVGNTTATSIAQELNLLQHLRQQGVLNQDEFEKEKRRILAQ
jgi:Na+/melibiose symporter-like transporter